MSSATSRRLFPGIAGYAATKEALNLLGQIARLELGPSGVVVSTVYPAATATEFPDHLRAGEMLAAARRIPVDPPELGPSGDRLGGDGGGGKRTCRQPAAPDPARLRGLLGCTAHPALRPSSLAGHVIRVVASSATSATASGAWAELRR